MHIIYEVFLALNMWNDRLFMTGEIQKTTINSLVFNCENSFPFIFTIRICICIHLFPLWLQIFTWNSDAWGFGTSTTSLYQSHPWVLVVLPDGKALGVLADTTRRCEVGFYLQDFGIEIYLLIM